jgi:hypothetical protein
MRGYLLSAGVLLALSAAPTAAATCKGQIAFLHHVMAVVDRETADAVSRSDRLRRYASLELRTTQMSGKPAWTGRYINMTHNYLELFGPGDSGDESPAGSIGLAIGGDAPGIADRMGSELGRAGLVVDRRVARRTLGGREVEWFASVRVKRPPEQATTPAVNAWAVEFQPEYFAAPEAARAPSLGAEDAISRRRYLANAYRGSPLADIAGITLSISQASYRRDIRPLLLAAGFCLRETRKGAETAGGEADIRLRFVEPASARLERVDFVLSAPARSRTTLQLGRSTLRIGPGRHARWMFDRR